MRHTLIQRLGSALTATLLLCGAAHADYAEHPRAAALMQTLRDDWGFTAPELAEVRTALADARQLPQLIAAEQNAAERTETWTTYARKRVDPARIEAGVRFIQTHREWMALAEEQYGVPPEVIAGVIGLETNYGGFTGSARVLDSLATQGFDHPSRTPFFFSELVQFFVFCRENDLDPRSPKGSYAGAMGLAQFMPSNYRRLAVDFDRDGDVDLWSPADAIGSVARYLTAYDPQRAWRPGEPMLLAVEPSSAPPPSLPRNGRRADLTLARLAEAGIRPQSGLAGDTAAGLVELTLDDGREYWLGLHNFYSVMSYNPRVYYAMTVARLAEEISRLQARTVAMAP